MGLIVWNDALLQKLYDLEPADKTVQDLAKALGMKVDSVRRICQLNNIQVKRQPYTLSPEAKVKRTLAALKRSEARAILVAEIRVLAVDCTAKSVAQKLGVSVTTIYLICQEYEIKCCGTQDSDPVVDAGRYLSADESVAQFKKNHGDDILCGAW